MLMLAAIRSTSAHACSARGGQLGSASTDSFSSGRVERFCKLRSSGQLMPVTSVAVNAQYSPQWYSHNHNDPATPSNRNGIDNHASSRIHWVLIDMVGWVVRRARTGSPS